MRIVNTPHIADAAKNVAYNNCRKKSWIAEALSLILNNLMKLSKTYKNLS